MYVNAKEVRKQIAKSIQSKQLPVGVEGGGEDADEEGEEEKGD